MDLVWCTYCGNPILEDQLKGWVEDEVYHGGCMPHANPTPADDIHPMSETPEKSSLQKGFFTSEVVEVERTDGSKVKAGHCDKSKFLIKGWYREDTREFMCAEYRGWRYPKPEVEQNPLEGVCYNPGHTGDCECKRFTTSPDVLAEFEREGITVEEARDRLQDKMAEPEPVECHSCGEVIEVGDIHWSSDGRDPYHVECWVPEQAPEPAPEFTAQVKCYSPRVKLPDEGEVVYSPYISHRVIHVHRYIKGRWQIKNIDKKWVFCIPPTKWFSINDFKQPLQIPAPWVACKDRLPTIKDVGSYRRRRGCVIHASAKGDIGTIHYSNLTEDCGHYWMPHSDKIDVGPLKAYIKALEGEG